jgi:hypothetical protein
MLPDEPNDEERREELPQDNQTPFRPADPAPNDATSVLLAGGTEDGQLSDTHPSTDTNIEAHELYDEGVSGAAEAEEPKTDDAVVGYGPTSTPTDAGSQTVSLDVPVEPASDSVPLDPLSTQGSADDQNGSVTQDAAANRTSDAANPPAAANSDANDDPVSAPANDSDAPDAAPVSFEPGQVTVGPAEVTTNSAAAPAPDNATIDDAGATDGTNPPAAPAS